MRKRFPLLFLGIIGLIAILWYQPHDSTSQSENSHENSQETRQKIRQDPSGRVLKYGIYELVRAGKLVKDQNTTTGKAISSPTIQHLEQTQRIPAQKDIYFSYQYRLSNLPGNKSSVYLKRILKHPEITLPNGEKKSGSEYMIKGRVKHGEVFAIDGYAFNEDYELVEGEWVFQIWYQDKKLVEQRFYSYLPDNSIAQQ